MSFVGRLAVERIKKKEGSLIDNYETAFHFQARLQMIPKQSHTLMQHVYANSQSSMHAEQVGL